MIKVAAVSYLNTLPFIYGFKKTNIINQIKLSLDYPALCAQRLLTNEVDIALVPVSILTKDDNLNIISDYCIGSDGNVDTVCLFSNSPIEAVNRIYLDYHSNTSVQLLRVLLKEYWCYNIQLMPLDHHGHKILANNEAELVIGDRALNRKKFYNYTYDLSFIWKEMTGMPFVFACWMAKKKIDSSFLDFFNIALSFGIHNIEEAIRDAEDKYPYKKDFIHDYLHNKISYALDIYKKQSLFLFLNKVRNLDSSE